jgi:ubiquinone/menaquinone biosynthesis C-methylase UbiE
MDLAALSIIEEYRQRAREPDISHMTGRQGRPDATDFIAEAALDEIRPTDGLLVDIGCGDGTLIRKATVLLPQLRCIGILPTQEEVDRTKSAFSGASDIRQGTVHHTGLPNGCADYIVCSGVLHIAPPLELSLQEIRRVAKPEAKILVTEIPNIDVRPGRDRWVWLRIVPSNFKHHGIAAGFGAIFYLARAAGSGRWTAMTTRPRFWIEPADFVQTAKACGLEVVKQFQYRVPDSGGTIVERPWLFNYVLRLY